MRTVIKKLRSRRGASITFALLLFLVCAVIGSAVLTAGTAAAGRMSQITERDQRYYSVNSAARVLIDMLESEEPTIVESTKKGSDISYKVNGVKIETSLPSFTSIGEEAAYLLVTTVFDGGETDDQPLHDLTLTVGDVDDLKVNIQEKFVLIPIEGLEPDVQLVLTLSSVDKKNPSSDKKYSMKLVYNLDMTEVKDVSTDNSFSPPVSTTVTTRRIAWHIQDIEIIGAGRRAGENNGG